jgi:hypothetical protein
MLQHHKLRQLLVWFQMSLSTMSDSITCRYFYRIFQMKFTTLLTTVALLSSLTVWNAPSQATTPNMVQPSAAVTKIAAGETAQQKIDKLNAVKGKEGSAELMRMLYPKDLNPIGIQRGGAGTVVNLYSKIDNTTISLCTTYDVIVAVRRGRITRFPSAEVK